MPQFSHMAAHLASRMKGLRAGTAAAAVLVPVFVLSGLGCEYSARERFFASRSATVMPQAGSGNSRIAIWPAAQYDRAALAALDRKTVSDTPAPADRAD